MSWGAVAVGVGTAAASYFGGKKKDDGFKKALKTMKAIIPHAEKARDTMDPFAEYRQGMADTLYGYLSGSKSIETDPGYQFTMQSAMQETNRAAAAKGYGQSGNVLAALQQRASDIASQQYGSIIDRLTNLAGAGSQNAISAGSQYGNMVTTALTGVAQAQAQQGASKGESTAGIMTGLSDAAAAYYNGNKKKVS